MFNNKFKEDSISEAVKKVIKDEESGLRMAAHAAHRQGKKSFEFQGKTYPVNVSEEEEEDSKDKSKGKAHEKKDDKKDKKDKKKDKKESSSESSGDGDLDKAEKLLETQKKQSEKIKELLNELQAISSKLQEGAEKKQSAPSCIWLRFLRIEHGALVPERCGEPSRSRLRLCDDSYPRRVRTRAPLV